jgi:glucose-1-phosphate cytidylyltransferase
VKAVILAGGYGTRISEESTVRPKPLVEIGDMPIMWHIMKLYEAAGVEDFIVCCGYKGHLIKDWFANYRIHVSDMTFDLKRDTVEVHANRAENWRVTCVDTGLGTMTGGRLRRVADYLDGDTFCMTYGDGLSDLDIADTIDFHRREGRKATLTAVQPPGRFGALAMTEGSNQVSGFREKPTGEGHTSWINGGFFVLEPQIFNYLEGDGTWFERDPLEKLAAQKQLAAYKHPNFWQCMDTLRDKRLLEEIWTKGQAPWKTQSAQ